MTIKFLGISWNLISITIFLFTLIVVTSKFKTKIRELAVTEKKKRKKARVNKNILTWVIKSKAFPLYLSWIVGTILFIVIGKIFKIKFNAESIIQFLFLTALANGGVYAVKDFVVPGLLELKKMFKKDA